MNGRGKLNQSLYINPILKSNDCEFVRVVPYSRTKSRNVQIDVHPDKRDVVQFDCAPRPYHGGFTLLLVPKFS